MEKYIKILFTKRSQKRMADWLATISAGAALVAVFQQSIFGFFVSSLTLYLSFFITEKEADDARMD